MSPPPWGRFALAIAGLGLLAALLYLGPSANGSSDTALRMLATALSILAGILLAIIAMLGDPRSLYPGSWRIASAHRRQIRHALNRAAMLFWLYLAVIALAFGATLLEAYAPSLIDSRWMKHCALSLGSVALLWSFSLPWVIRKAQLARLDDEVERRRKQARSVSDDAEPRDRSFAEQMLIDR